MSLSENDNQTHTDVDVSMADGEVPLEPEFNIEDEIAQLCLDLGIDSIDSLLMQIAQSSQLDDEAQQELNVEALFKTAGERIEGDNSVVTPTVQAGFAPPGKRIWREHVVPAYASTSGILEERGSDIVLTTPDGCHVVGAVVHPTGMQVSFNCENLLTMTDMVSEDVKLKATGMGYSVWIHFAVVVAIARAHPESCIEPVEGGDILVNVSQESGWSTVDRSIKSGARLPVDGGVRIEVTGVNWARRNTSCDWVLGKYALLGRLLEDPADRRVLELALAEDQYDPTVIAELTPEDQRGRYFDVCVRLLRLVRSTTLPQRQALGSMAQRYFWSLPNENDGTLPFEDKRSLVDDILDGGAKNGRLPAPCRIAAVPQPPPDVAFAMSRLEPDCRWSPSMAKSTYHTVKSDDRHGAIEKALARSVPPVSTAGVPLGFAVDAVPATSISGCILMESTLLRRVVGTRGCKFDDSVSAGVVWQRTRDNMFKVAYYTWVAPDPLLAGDWGREVSGDLTYFRSPTFTVSNTDLEYAQCLAARHETWTRMFVEVTDRQLCHKLLAAEAKVLLCLHNSSWRTSVWMKNVRFTTSLRIGGAVDLDPVLTKGWAVAKELRSSEWCFLHLARACMPHWQTTADSTPIFGFPLLWASLEKDVDLMTQWHIRKGHHATDCMQSMVEAFQDEELTIEQSLLYLERQEVFLTAMFEVGAAYRDFAKLMDSAPEYPMTNVVWALAEAEVTKKHFATAFAAQSRTGFTISSMLSNRGGVEVKGNTLHRKRAFRSIASYCKRTGQHTPMRLLTHALEHPELPTYGITPKDQKNGDRDISTQSACTRVRQAAAESFFGTTGGAAGADLLQDPAKHEKAGKALLKALRYKGGTHVTTSEDRSKFCHNFRPQAMAVALYCIGLSASLNFMTTAAGIMSQFGLKEVVVPPGFDETRLPLSGVKLGKISTTHAQSQLHKTPSIRSERSFQQGMFANAGGLINDLGMIFWTETVAAHPQVASADGMTTSDDSCRSVCMRVATSKAEVDAKIIMPAMRAIMYDSQLNNDRKFISSSVGAEFNRVAYVEDGPIPQAPVLAALAIQPMNGDSLVHDLMQCHSSARVVMLWGGTPFAMYSAYAAGVEYACSRWRVSESQYGLLCAAKLVLQSAHEVLSPWRPRTNVVNFLIERSKGESNNVHREPSTWLLRRYGGRRKYEVEEFVFPGSFESRLSMQNLLTVVTEGGRLDLKWQRRPTLKRLMEKRNGFFKDLEEAFNACQTVEALPDVDGTDLVIIPRCARRDDFAPKTMAVVHKVAKVDVSRVLCLRLLKAAHQVVPADEEAAMAAIPDELEFYEAVRGAKMVNEKTPTIHATTGMSQGHIFDNVLYKIPMTFDVHPRSTDVVDRRETRMMRLGLVEFRNVSPCFWNDQTVQMAQGCQLAFATASTQSGRLAFYSGRKHEVEVAHIPDATPAAVGRVTTGGRELAYTNGYTHGTVTIEETDVATVGFRGSSTALVNIDGYIHSRSRRAVALKRKYLKEVGGSLPDCIVDLLPANGVKPRNRQVIDCGRHYTIIGNETSDCEFRFNPSGGEYVVYCQRPGWHVVELIVQHGPEQDALTPDDNAIFF